MNKAKYVIADYRCSDEILQNLLKYAEKVVLTKKINTYDQISGHADVQVCKISSDEIICTVSCYEYYKESLTGITVTCGSKETGNSYPDDIMYNAYFTDTYMIHNLDFTDSELLRLSNNRNLKMINTKQGYAKCSICELSDGAIITDDESIYKALKQCKKEILKIEKGPVRLYGFDYGFIGGASGLYKNNIFFTGKVENTDIVNFCLKHNTMIIELSNEPLTDVGSLIFLN